MKKSFICILVFIMIAINGICQAASYTLPEKMYNQLSIGSGLKGSFTITAEGEAFRTPFMNAVTDAVFSIRGISSGKDIHYYLFQGDEQEKQTAVTELYRKDGAYYLRSDMVPGKILVFPAVSQYIDALFPAEGENGSASSFIANILSLSEQERKEKWDPVLTRYQNALEFWLADYTVDHETVKMEDGFSALDFTYEIPSDDVKNKIISLISDILSDEEAYALLESVMSPKEKSVYLNRNLLYFYTEAVNALNIENPVRMNKRVSAMGDLLRFKLELPLDEKSTGYQSVTIEMYDKLTVYTVRRTEDILVLAIPDAESLKETEFDKNIWISRIIADENKKDQNFSVKANIRKTHNAFDENEKSHETERYEISISQDTTYIPQDIDLSILPEFIQTDIIMDLHYSSKYAQNSATTLEIAGEIKKGTSEMKIEGSIKTAAPWVFMPFDVVDPINVGTDVKTVLEPYITDWISNATSIIHHMSQETDTVTDQNEIIQTDESESRPKDVEATADDMSEEAETSPMDNPEQE